MDTLANFEFTLWVCNSSPILCRRKSLSRGPPFLHPHASFSFPWRRHYPGSWGGGTLCPQVWRSDVQFAWKHLLCPDGEFFWVREGGRLGTEELSLASSCLTQCLIDTWDS